MATEYQSYIESAPEKNIPDAYVRNYLPGRKREQ